MGLLDGKVAIVTGAGGGLGRAHALALAKEGAKVVVNDLGGARDGSGAGHSMADGVVDEIKKAGGDAIANYDSVATAEGGQNIVKAAVEKFGRLDILVNNAGILRDKTFAKMDEAMWDAVMAVHVKALYCVTKPAYDHMVKQGQGGRIISTSSIAGLRGNFGQTNYGAAKAAVAGFTRCLAMEAQRSNITVNAVAPVAKTRMTEDISAVPDDITPEMISPVVVFLASPLAEGVTGRIFGAHGPQVFEYKQVMTPAVTKEGGLWTAQEIAAKLDEIGRDPTFTAPGAAAAAGAAPADTGAQVAALFKATPATFKKDKAGDWTAVLHFDVKGTGIHTIAVKGGNAEYSEGAKGDPTAVVTFASADVILGMAKGTVKPEAAFMAGQIKSTDLGALMNFGKYFKLADAAKATQYSGAGAAAGGAAPAAGGGVNVTPAQAVEEILNRMPEGFVPEKAGGWSTVLHIDIGGVGTWTLTVEGGKAKSGKGASGLAKARIAFADADTLLNIVKGALKPEQAFMGGKIKSDNMGELMKFGQVFDLKGAAKKVADAEAQLKSGGGGIAAAAEPEEGLNRKLLGRRYKAPAVFIGRKQIVDFALATEDKNPRYIAERDGQIAPPLFAANPLMKVVGMVVMDEELRADLLRLVHGEQEMTFYRPIYPGDVVAGRAEVYKIEDKSSGQLLQVRQGRYADGQLITDTLSGYFIRGKSKGGKKDEKKPEAEAPAAKPVYVLEDSITVADDQPIRYAAASGDNNPIHTDPDTARAAGHPNIILHGMCTMAFAQNAIVNKLCGGDPLKLKRLKVRFSKIVLPQDKLTTRAWKLEEKGNRLVLGFETFNQDGKPVLANAEAEIVK